MARPSYKCYSCDFGYIYVLKDMEEELKNKMGLDNVKFGFYDIDVVLEANKQFKSIFEWKNTYQMPKEFDEFKIPAFEYVGLKKIGRMMKVPPYVVFHHMDDPTHPENNLFTIIPIDRFETERQFRREEEIKAIFDRKEAYTVDYEELKKFILRLIRNGGKRNGYRRK